jgi:predicted GNAT family N-acyltransferase
VVIDPSMRRKGLGRIMMKEYVEYIKKEQQQFNFILLITKQYLIEFYGSCGFILVGESNVVHGYEKWFEMKMVIAK